MGRVQHPWARHFQGPWEERAAKRSVPAYLRVAFLAYARHHANGHAIFQPGEIGLLLGRPTPSEVELVKPMDKHNVQRAIRVAVAEEWLAVGSGSTCLIVPGHAIEGGLGNPFEPCPRHGPVGR
jgi:hypothetical protein